MHGQNRSSAIYLFAEFLGEFMKNWKSSNVGIAITNPQRKEI